MSPKSYHPLILTRYLKFMYKIRKNLLSVKNIGMWPLILKLKIFSIKLCTYNNQNKVVVDIISPEKNNLS